FRRRTKGKEFPGGAKISAGVSHLDERLIEKNLAVHRLDELEARIQRKLATHDQAIAGVLDTIRALMTRPSPSAGPSASSPQKRRSTAKNTRRVAFASRSGTQLVVLLESHCTANALLRFLYVRISAGFTHIAISQACNTTVA